MGKARRAVGLRGNVNVFVTTNRKMRELNRQFRRKDKPTDVLSFPSVVDPFPSDPTLPAGRVGHPNFLAGEIAISGEIAAQNGGSLGHATAVELKVLVLHGVLHLAGHDHENDDGQMARKEQELRRELRLPEGLIERAAAVAAPRKSRSLAVLGMTPRGERARLGRSAKLGPEKRKAARGGR